MAASTFKDHFSGTSAAYAAYRPTYPSALVDFLADCSPGQQRAWDCGCGTGQLSVLLAARFSEVIATDASSAQIKRVQPADRVIYRVATAEDSGLAPASTDLVTVAQAAHWFDLPRFYDEVQHVARPGAVLALITYGVLHVDDQEVDQLVQHFYTSVVGPYWPPERRHVEDGYRSLPFPFPEIEAPALGIEVHWRLEDLLGYVQTWSAVKEAAEVLGEQPLADLRTSLARAWGDPAARRAVSWPLSLRVGRV